MLTIDRYAYINKLAAVHPLEKITFTFLMLLSTLLLKDIYLSLITFFVMSAFIILVAQIPASYYVKLLLLPSFFLITSLATILLSFAPHEVALPPHVWSTTFLQWQLFIGKASLHIAYQLFFTVLASISCLYFLILTTPIQAICSMLRKARLPLLFIELVELTYRFIFMFIESMQKIHVAQQARLGYTQPMQALRSTGLLVTSLFVDLLKRSKELNNAMQARGGEFVYWEENKQYSKNNWMMLGAVFVSLIVYGGAKWIIPLFSV